MQNVVVALTICVFASGAVAQEQGRVAKLEKENLLLKRRIAELEQEVGKLWAKLRGKKYTANISLPFDGRKRPPHLEGITLPDTPTKDEVRRYVVSILRAAGRHRGGYGADDPEIALLEKVGPAHVDLLVEPLLYDGLVDGAVYLLAALKSLVGDEHKKYILWQLPIVRDLVEVVIAKEWTADAAPVLLRILADRDQWESRGYLPIKWVEAVAQLKRRDSYKGLKAYLYYGLNRYHTWKAIRGLPGIELEDTVGRLWDWAKDVDDVSTRRDVAGMAAHYGRLDALAALFGDPATWPAWDALNRLTGLRCDGSKSAEEAKRWYAEHKNRLVFDPAKRVYRVKKDGE